MTKQDPIAKSIKAEPTPVHYIFIDVVEFTRQNRDMDHMVAIITALNDIVKDQLNEHALSGKRRQVVVLATGDGMCLCLLRSTRDKQIQLAFDIQRAVEGWNLGQTIPQLKFKLRTALNVYEDYKIKDINNKWNLIGHGINTAARIQGLCEPGEIVVSGHMYSSLEKTKFMNMCSPEKQQMIKGEDYRYRRIELSEENRTWKKEVSSTKVEVEELLEQPSAMEGRRKVDWPKPKLLINEPFDESLVIDNGHRYDAGHGKSWHPSREEPKQLGVLGFQSYSKEFELRSSFRSFTSLVSPNAVNFKLVMKLMNESGKLPAHMVYGEASFILEDDTGTGGMVLGYQEGGERHERPIPDIPRPRFEVGLKVRPIRTSKLLAAQLYINQKLVQTKMIPREFTARFGIVASGNGKVCHMSFSEIGVYTVAK